MVISSSERSWAKELLGGSIIQGGQNTALEEEEMSGYTIERVGEGVVSVECG